MPTSHGGLCNLLYTNVDPMKVQMKMKLEKMIGSPSMGTDIWTNKAMKDSVIGTTVHFYASNSEMICKLFLGLIRLEGSHTAGK
jgi:hypothetical protein